MNPLQVELPGNIRSSLYALSAVGIVTAIAGAMFDPVLMWPNFLLVSYFALTLALGGLAFVAIHYASGATWGVAVRRIPEAMASLIPFAALAVGVVLVYRPQIYPWTGVDPAAGAEGGALAFKRMWLAVPFFLLRALVYAALWTFFSYIIRRHSRLQDSGHDAWRTIRNRRVSIAFLVVFGLTFSLASFDWVMSLEPSWSSTIFGVYNFAGLFLSTLAVVVLVALWLEDLGPLKGVLTENHLHDLGKLLLAFCTFWAYIWFSQYMLIWYANMNEETPYFVARTRGGWAILFYANVALNWAIPFLTLLSRPHKRTRTIIGSCAGILLVGRYLDLYLMIMPSVRGASPMIGPWELGLLAAGVGLFSLGLIGALRSAPVVPVGDPHLSDSLQYEQ